MTSSVDLARQFLSTPSSPSWLELPTDRDIVGLIREHLLLVRRGLLDSEYPERNAGDDIKATYLAEGLWSLDQVCRRVGTSFADADDELLTSIIEDPASGYLRGQLAMEFLCSQLPVVSQDPVGCEELLDAGRSSLREEFVWQGPGAQTGEGFTLDGFVSLPDVSTVVWLVSWPEKSPVPYKALAQRLPPVTV